jgi:hypothetical protein
MAYKIPKQKSREKSIYGMNVKEIEKTARAVMRIDNKIWQKHGWTNGGMVDSMIYRVELIAELDKKGIKRLPYIYYHIFEDANYHTLNSALEDRGRLSGNYGEAQKDFDEYSRKGGKTWEL